MLAGSNGVGLGVGPGRGHHPILGTKRSSYLRDNAQAIHLLLSAAGRQRLNAVSAEVAGERYPQSLMKGVSR